MTIPFSHSISLSLALLLAHKLAQRPATPVHEIKARQCGPDGQAGSQISLVLSRAQSPLDPVIWTPSAPGRVQRSEPGLRDSPSPTKYVTKKMPIFTSLNCYYVINKVYTVLRKDLFIAAVH